VSEPTNEVRARRRTVTAIGCLVLFVTSATACIFEKSTYQGGGRQDQGAETTTAQPSGSATTPPPDPTTTPTSTADTGTTIVVDAAINGG
jgi:hypothetical protein